MRNVHWQEHVRQVPEFLNYLRREYLPRHIAGGEERKLFDKTIHNFYFTTT
jgi:hypothetical protein